MYYYEELIGRFGLKERIIISSFNHLSALSCKDFMPDMKTGALVENGGIANAGYYCKKFGFECYHPGVEGLTKEEVELCHKNGIEVNVWTINNMDDLENLYEWGCDGVITNYPDVCKSWLKAKKRRAEKRSDTRFLRRKALQHLQNGGYGYGKAVLQFCKRGL